MAIEQKMYQVDQREDGRVVVTSGSPSDFMAAKMLGKIFRWIVNLYIKLYVLIFKLLKLVFYVAFGGIILLRKFINRKKNKNQ